MLASLRPCQWERNGTACVVLSNYLVLVLFLNKHFRTARVRFLDVCVLSGSSSIRHWPHHLVDNKSRVCWRTTPVPVYRKKTARGCRFLRMFTSRVYIISPLAPQTRKAKGPAFLFVCAAWKGRGNKGLRTEGKFKLRSQQYNPGNGFVFCFWRLDVAG